MNAMASRMARILASADAATALASVPIAVADPSDLPICEAGQSPEEAECTTGCPDNAPLDTRGFCTQPGTADITGGPADVPFAPNAGADPQLPSGADPGISTIRAAAKAVLRQPSCCCACCGESRVAAATSDTQGASSRYGARSR